MPKRGCSAAAVAAGILLAAPPAGAWSTIEHIRFGQDIAGPFEDEVTGERLPVIAAEGGPQSFGQWVSAPDFGRGLLAFLTRDPVVGAYACALVWNPRGEVDGEVIDDQDLTLFENTAWLDCLDTLRMNNSHFGDFAAFHYAHYHAMAVEAARRYRANRQPVCRDAAYTLEAWGQHYLTDATASGHAWNPAGTYDAGFDWQTTNAVSQRMRIHNHLNEHGATFAGALGEGGRMWGDHAGDGVGDAQRALTLHLSRMSLGQVVMTAECGGPVTPDDVLDGGDPLDDPRRMYADDATMCDVMYGEEIGTWHPSSWEDLGVDMPEVLAAVDRCRDGDGVITAGGDDALLARHWFQDKYYQVSPVDGFVSATLDPHAILDPADLGCDEDLPVLPVAEGERDACGMLVCETPPERGACPIGTYLQAGCCFPAPLLLDAGGAVTVTPWRSAAEAAPVALGAVGAVSGESPAFLWFRGAPGEIAGGAPVRIDAAETATLASPATIEACGREASFTVHEARVVLPRDRALATTAIELAIEGMDEGLRVEVDGRAIAYLTRRDLDDAGGALVVPLFGQALPERAGGHVVRLVHLNDCGTTRPLVVRLEARGRIDVDDPTAGADEDEAGEPGGCGCATGGGAAPGGALALVALAIATRRRRRDRR